MNININKSCTIAFNDYNQMILHSANTVFLERLGFSDRNIGSGIDTLFSKAFISFLHTLYAKNIGNKSIISKYYKLLSPSLEPLHLIVSLDNSSDVPLIICKVLDILCDDSASLSSCCCKIKDGEIISASYEFCKFVEQYNLSLEDFSKSDALISSMKSQMPQMKLYMFSDRLSQRLRIMSAIPLTLTEYILYINDIPKESLFHNILKLTPRELEILKLASKGIPNRIIASTLNITEGCVSKILSNSYAKLEISSKIEILNLL